MSKPRPLNHDALVREIRAHFAELDPYSVSKLNDYLQGAKFPTAHVEEQYDVPGVLLLVARTELELHRAKKALLDSGHLPAAVGVTTIPEFAGLVRDQERRRRTGRGAPWGWLWRLAYRFGRQS